MRMKLAISAAVALTVGSAAFAQNVTAIKARQAVMKSFGDTGENIGKMLRGQVPFDLAVTQTFLNTVIAGAQKAPGLFPDDSKTGAKTAALPVIWDDKPKFLAGFTKLEADAKSALALIKDEASFKSEMPKVAGNCGGCHKVYQKPE